MFVNFRQSFIVSLLGFSSVVCLYAMRNPEPATETTSTIDFVSSSKEFKLHRSAPLKFDIINRAPLPAGRAANSCVPVNDDCVNLPAGVYPDPSLCLHLLKLTGWDGNLVIVRDQEKHRVKLRDLIFEGDLAKKFLGDASFTPTRYGVRFPTKSAIRGSAADESHRDQCLAMLAEFGVELSQPLTLGNDAYELRDVLRDSIANFHLEQKELAWTTVAYASYLPPLTAWENRFGMRFTFDDLAKTMMDRPRDQLSCGGTHVYYALTVLLRADRAKPVLTESTRSQLTRYLRDAVTMAIKNQKSDGTWSMKWWSDQLAGEDPKMSDAGKVLITGHMAEWLMYVPDDLLVSQFVLRRAGLWLSSHLTDAPESAFWKEVCPYTHAIFVVQP